MDITSILNKYKPGFGFRKLSMPQVTKEELKRSASEDLTAWLNNLRSVYKGWTIRSTIDKVTKQLEHEDLAAFSLVFPETTTRFLRLQDYTEKYSPLKTAVTLLLLSEQLDELIYRLKQTHYIILPNSREKLYVTHEDKRPLTKDEIQGIEDALETIRQIDPYEYAEVLSHAFRININPRLGPAGSARFFTHIDLKQPLIPRLEDPFNDEKYFTAGTLIHERAHHRLLFSNVLYGATSNPIQLEKRETPLNYDLSIKTALEESFTHLIQIRFLLLALNQTGHPMISSNDVYIRFIREKIEQLQSEEISKTLNDTQRQFVTDLATASNDISHCINEMSEVITTNNAKYEATLALIYEVIERGHEFEVLPNGSIKLNSNP